MFLFAPVNIFCIAQTSFIILDFLSMQSTPNTVTG